MNHVIIFAHPQQSLNQTLLDLVVSTLLNNGHKVTVRDVYALGFPPELTFAEKAPSNAVMSQSLFKESRR